MPSRKRILLSSTMVPLVMLAGVAAGGAVVTVIVNSAPATAHGTAKKANPCAAAKVNPCAAAKANPCAAASNPCNPCAAAASPCNPCAANPCKAAANPCNPCAANPCAANPCNPCNPCAAGGSVSQKCVVPRLRTAAAKNPCNPCNPCAATKNPCNPCAANPCNPCAANPCNPCAAGAAADLTEQEVIALYDCLMDEMKAAYAKSGVDMAATYMTWPRYSRHAYVSATHGNRYVQNYANPEGRAYGLYEEAGTLPQGTKLAKDSFSVTGKGNGQVGPLFLMEKMQAGFNAESGDWRYTMIMPNGSVFGTTNGQGADKVAFCAGCHISVAPDQDSIMLLPEEYRVER